MKWTFFFFFIFFSCGDLLKTPDPVLIVKIVGTQENPSSIEDPEGSAEPITQNYQIESLNFLDENESLVEVSDDSISFPMEMRISDRLLKVFKKKILTSEVGTIYKGFQITLASSVTGSSRYESNHKLSLSDTDRTITQKEKIKILKGKDLTITLYVKWRHTIVRNEENKTDSDMLNPGFRMTIEH